MRIAGETENTCTKADMIRAITKYAEERFPDRALSGAQRVSKALDTPVGVLFYKVLKVSPGTEIEIDIEIDEEPYIDIAKLDATIRGPAHAKMHSLAEDISRATGRSFERSYTAAYTDPKMTLA
jgi:hypothetical protein